MELLDPGLLNVSGVTLLGIVVTIAISWFFISTFKAWYRLSHVPGPFLASFSSLWIVKHVVKGRIAHALLGLQEHGRLVRVGPNYLLTDDPETLRQISAARSQYNRDEWWVSLSLTPGSTNLATILEAEPHDKVKAKMAAAYAGRDNMDSKQLLDSDRLLAHFRLPSASFLNQVSSSVL